MLVLLALAELLGMVLWLVGSAVGPSLTQQWSLSRTDVAWLTTAGHAYREARANPGRALRVD